MRNCTDPHVWRGLALPRIVVASPGRPRRGALTASRRDWPLPRQSGRLRIASDVRAVW